MSLYPHCHCSVHHFILPRPFSWFSTILPPQGDQNILKIKYNVFMISSSTPFSDLPFLSESLREPALHYLCSSYFSRILSLHSLPALCFMTNFLLFFRLDVLSLASGPLPMIVLCMGYLSTPLSSSHHFIVWVSAEASLVSRSLSWLLAPLSGSFLFPNHGSVHCHLSDSLSPLCCSGHYMGAGPCLCTS